MDDLLKEAIADAKAVRETALENAKMALEEAFTPRLQSMLSKKIQTELEDDEQYEDDEDPSDEYSDEPDAEPAPEEEPLAAQDEIPGDEEPSDEAPADDEEELDMEGVIEINGIKYAPVVSEEDEEDEEGENPFADDDEMEESEDLDLEAVIKELESELAESEEDKEEVDEQSDSSDIGKGDNKVDAADAGDEEDPGKGKLSEQEDDDEEVEEDIDLDEVLKALSEEEDDEDDMEEVAKLKSDLDEHRSVIETLRGKLNEVNLLNAKLLFTNKLFRKYGLNNEQKMKVVEQFDRAANLREVKLVYSTLGESFGTARNEINESKGAASKPVASTKSEKKVISEGSDLRDRFKKLANIL